MSFGEAVSTCLRKFADPNGRASRAEFWYFYLALLLGNVGAFLLATLVSIVVPPVGGGLFLLILVANVVSLIPLLCVQARRFHDQDLSGALVLLNLFFLVIPLVFMCLEGTRGPNRHGPDPRWGDDAGYGPALYGPGQGGYALPAPDVSYGQPGYGPQPGYGQPDAPGFGQQAYGQGYEQSTWGRADYAQPGYGHQQAAPAWRPDASVPPSPAFGQQGAQPDPDARSYYPDGSRDVPGEPSAAPAGGPDPAPHQSSPFPRRVLTRPAGTATPPAPCAPAPRWDPRPSRPRSPPVPATRSCPARRTPSRRCWTPVPTTTHAMAPRTTRFGWRTRRRPNRPWCWATRQRPKAPSCWATRRPCRPLTPTSSGHHRAPTAPPVPRRTPPHPHPGTTRRSPAVTGR